jgi:hypothetical protein
MPCRIWLRVNTSLRKSPCVTWLTKNSAIERLERFERLERLEQLEPCDRFGLSPL